MDKDQIQRYELAIYLLIGLIALVLFLFGTFIITEGTLNDIVLSMSSELLGVAIIFFILNRVFLLSTENQSRQQTNTLAKLMRDSQEQTGNLVKLTQDVSAIKQASLLSDQLKITEELGVIRKSLGSIDQDIDALTRKITSEFDKQQKQLLQTIEREFTSEIEKSHKNLEVIPMFWTTKGSK